MAESRNDRTELPGVAAGGADLDVPVSVLKPLPLGKQATPEALCLPGMRSLARAWGRRCQASMWPQDEGRNHSLAHGGGLLAGAPGHMEGQETWKEPSGDICHHGFRAYSMPDTVQSTVQTQPSS